MKAELNPVLDDNDGTFWMCYQDFIKQFNGVNICRVDNYHEARIKGTFERNLVGEQEWVSSKSYFVVQSKKKTNVILGLHQEDARNYGVDERRPYLDLGLVVLDVTGGNFKLFKAKEAVSERQVELEIEIEPNKPYLIWPRTSGCGLCRYVDSKSEPTVSYENGEIHPLFVSTIQDLFRKSNKMLGEDLSYIEFSSLMSRVNVHYSNEEFLAMIEKYPSYEQGLTSEGFIEYMRDQFEERGEGVIKEWLKLWGYDNDLYSIKSRYYVLTFHSNERLKIQMKNSAGLELNDRIHEMLLQKSSEKKGETDRVQLHCLMEKAANSFTYGVYNDNNHRVQVTLDCSNSEGLTFSGIKPIMNHFVEAKQWKILTHCQISKTATACKLKPNFKVSRA